MTIPTEAWPILTILFTALGFWWRQRSVAQTQRELAEAKSKLLTAEGELATVKADAAQTTTLANIAERQQTLLESLKSSQDSMNAEILARWSNISLLFSDIRAGEANIYNTLLKVSATLGEINAAQKQLPALIQEANNQAFKEAAGLIGAEMGASMAREFAVKNAERTMHPFPASEDKGWRDEFVIPLVADLFINKEPYFDDDARLKKSCSKINPQGETLRLMDVPSIDAVAVYKVEDGVPCYGWLSKRSIKIGQPALPVNSS